MHYITSKINIVIVALITFTSFQTHSQTKSDIQLYTKFDSIVGNENLGLINGPIALNPYKTIGSNNMYFKNEKYTVGSINYDGQFYYNVNLKYDISKDQLILNPAGQPEHIGINIIQDKTNFFSIYEKNFIKLNKNQTALPEFESGYYEQLKISETFNLYIRHHKIMQNQINDKEIYYTFNSSNHYYIDYNSKFYEISSKSSIVKIFPNYKKQINTFYDKNRSLRKTDNDEFMNILMISIYNYTINNSK